MVLLNKQNEVDTPTLLLQNRSFETITNLTNVSDIVYKNNFNSANEISFDVYKYNEDAETPYWDSIIDFKILYIPEFAERFEINVSTTQEDDTVKSITATALCESELGQTILRDIEINTEDDIARDDYDVNFPTVFYRDVDDIDSVNWNAEKYNGKYSALSDADKKSILENSSLLHRLLDKAPHYNIGYVQDSLKDIQREFSISETSIYDELTGDIADEFNCLFLFDSMTRTINVYDLYNTCSDCGYRGDFNDVCPDCGSTNFSGQYGKDTTIFISNENLAESITRETDPDSLKNCFYVEGGDDIITAAVRSVNPNGGSYIYRFSDKAKEDMPEELSAKIEEYEELYDYYNNDYVFVDSIDVPEDFTYASALYSEFYDNYCSSLTDSIQSVLQSIIDGDSSFSEYISVDDIETSGIYYIGTTDILGDSWKDYLYNYICSLYSNDYTFTLENYEYSDSTSLNLTCDVTIEYSDDVLDTFSINITLVPDGAVMGNQFAVLETLGEYGSAYFATEDATNTLVKEYNELVSYINTLFEYDEDDAYNEIAIPLVGYKNLSSALYDVIDFYTFLNDGMLPTVDTDELGIEDSLNAIINGFSDTFSNVISYLTPTSLQQNYVEKLITKTAKIFFSTAYYDFEVTTNSYTKATSGTDGSWTGYFTLTSLTEIDDETEDYVTVSNEDSPITLTINSDYATFIQQSISQAVAESDSMAEKEITSFSLSDEDFETQLHFYSLTELENLREEFQSCLDIIIDSGIESADEDLYKQYYYFYYRRIYGTDADGNSVYCINDEIDLRTEQIETVSALYYYDSEDYSASGILYDFKTFVNSVLNFEDFIGEDLYLIFCAYRREDTYSNSNYISDGLNNAEIIEMALLLLDVANKELYKASEPQYTLTSTMSDLLALPAFEPLVDYFETGNWIRLEIDDSIYRLRLLSFEISFDDVQSIDVEFSTVQSAWTGTTDIESVIESASQMATSYDSVIQQVENTATTSSYVKNWVRNGLSATQTKFSNADNQTLLIDSHGLLARSYNDVEDEYSVYQLKITNNGLYTTSDAWQTIDTGVGRISYTDPETGEDVDDYGIIAKTVIGKLILGEHLGIYNESGNLKFTDSGLFITMTDEDSNTGALEFSGNGFIITTSSNGTFVFDNSGLTVSNGDNTVNISPDSDKYLFNIQNGTKNVFYIDENGTLHMRGTIYTTSGSIGGFTIKSDSISNDYINISSLSTSAAITLYYKSGEIAMILDSHDTGGLSLYDNDDGNPEVFWLQPSNGYLTYFVSSGLKCDDEFYINCTNGLYIQNTTTSRTIKPETTATYALGQAGNSTNDFDGLGWSNIYIGNKESTINALRFIDDQSNYTLIGMNSNDHLQVGNSTYATYMVGSTIYMNGSSYSSDLRYKEDLGTLDTYDGFFDALEPISYKYTARTNADGESIGGTSGRRHIGFGAQTVLQALEDNGLSDMDFAGYVDMSKDDENTDELALRYSEFIALNTYQIQQLKTRVKELEETISNLTTSN